MRRKDREITDKNRINEFIAKEQILRIAFYDEGDIYIVPVNYGYIYDEQYTFYFHGAKAGRKYELAKNSTHKLILKLKEFRKEYGKDFYFMEAMRSPVNKIKNKHRYQIVLRYSCSIHREVLDKIYKLLDETKNNKLSVFVENNPVSLS